MLDNDTDRLAAYIHIAKSRPLTDNEHKQALACLHRIEKHLGLWDLTTGDPP